MAKKRKTDENETAYVCACGSGLFVQKGTANFKENVTISMSKDGMIVEGGDPELDIIDSTIKCAACGAEVN